MKNKSRTPLFSGKGDIIFFSKKLSSLKDGGC